MNFIIIFFLLFMGCTKIEPTIKSSCSNNGNIHFMYVDVPCEECVSMIEEIFNLNSNIFDYNMVRSKENHILINYCYNSQKTNIFFIEKSISDIGLLVNQPITSRNINSDNLCCSSE